MLPLAHSFSHQRLRSRLAILLAILTIFGGECCDRAQAAGLFVDGPDAHSQALGGASVAGFEQSPQAALGTNPAALSLVQPAVLELGGDLGWVNGDFHNRANSDAHMSQFGAMPDGAIAGTYGPLSLGFGVLTDAAMRANWNYRDTPGGLDGATTYGVRTNMSELELVRFALGASYAITPQLSLGASVGLLYNRNELKAPYIIQTQPELAGAKTLLDMETEGWGWNGQFGVLWEPVKSVRLGISYTLPSTLHTTGHATSDASQQLANLGLRGVDATTNFDADVKNDFPQTLSGGLDWKITKQWETVAQVDWINWASAFNTLDVRLLHTDSALYRALLGGQNHLDDNVPLNWRDQVVARFGLEYHVTDDFSLRAGYRYARNPVPSDTLTPLTAAIDEHMLTAGFGYRWKCVTFDLAYQYYLPETAHVGTSSLLSGEYSNSDIKVSIQMLTATLGIQF